MPRNITSAIRTFLILDRGPKRLSDEAFQNLTLATVQSVFSRTNLAEPPVSPAALHRDLMRLFVQTVGHGYLSKTELTRASRVFDAWIPRMSRGSII